jgi:hypothetical protein
LPSITSQFMVFPFVDELAGDIANGRKCLSAETLAQGQAWSVTAPARPLHLLLNILCRVLNRLATAFDVLARASHGVTTR